MIAGVKITNPFYGNALCHIHCDLAADGIAIIYLCSTMALISQKNEASTMHLGNLLQKHRRPCPHPKSDHHERNPAQ